MERTSSISQFEKAIKDFSKISIEIDSLINKENAEAIRIKNKSIENRKEAISNEASRRIVSFDMDQKESKTKSSPKTHDTLEERILKEVEVEFDKGVTKEKLLLRGNSEAIAENISESNKEEEDAESAETVSEESTDDESSEKESTEEENTDEESTEDENTEDTSEESTSEESTDGETSDKDNSDNVKSDEENVNDEVGKVDDLNKNK